jgi:23S rRNA (uracil1939-C5)-methyltransferase
LALKREFLRQAFLHTEGAGEPPDIAVVPSRPFEYRNRVQFRRLSPALPSEGSRRPWRARTLRPGGASEPIFGFMSRSGGRDGAGGAGDGQLTAEVVPVRDCLIADPAIRRALRTDAITPPVHKDRFSVYGKDGTLFVEGDDGGAVNIAGRMLRMDAGLFFQSNGAMLEALLDGILRIAATAAPDGRAADLYCGVGTFAAFLQDRFCELDLLEADKDAVRLARLNVSADGARFFAQDDRRFALNRQRDKAAPYVFAVADPGRQGMDEAMCRFLASGGCGLLCYVSCNPSALARDTALLRAGGLSLDALTFYDFYPQTRHVESLAVFRRQPRQC